jgi:hypothetical protein
MAGDIGRGCWQGVICRRFWREGHFCQMRIMSRNAFLLTEFTLHARSGSAFRVTIIQAVPPPKPQVRGLDDCTRG